MTTMEKAEGALARARGRVGPNANDARVVEGFAARGIPVADIIPRQNVLSYDAWRALGRHVRKGEHGVKLLTYVEGVRERTDDATGMIERKAFKRPWTVHVFHISQTDADAPRVKARAGAKKDSRAYVDAEYARLEGGTA